MVRKLQSDKTLRVIKDPALVILQGRTSNAARKLWKKAAMPVALTFMGPDPLKKQLSRKLLRWDEPLQITVEDAFSEASISDAFAAIQATCSEKVGFSGDRTVTVTPCKEFYRQQAKRREDEARNTIKQSALVSLTFPAAGPVLLGLCGPPETNVKRMAPQTRAYSVPVPFLLEPKYGQKLSHELLEIFQKLRKPSEPTEAEKQTIEAFPDSIPSVIVEIVMGYLANMEEFAITSEGALGFNTTGSACLDYYAKQQPAPFPHPRPSEMFETYDSMWNEDPVATLNLIFVQGSARDGKQDLYGFLGGCMWLWNRHPSTLLQNLEVVPKTNYYKSLLQILAMALEGEDMTFERETEFAERIKEGNMKTAARQIVRDKFQELSKFEQARAVLWKYDLDVYFRALHCKVAQIFAEALKSDMEVLKEIKAAQCSMSDDTAHLVVLRRRMSLAAKWVPSVGASFDRRTLICEAIARRLFPVDSFENSATWTEFQWSFHARERLRKEVLSPLRECLRITERLVSLGRSAEIDFSAVPCQSMKRNLKVFAARDRERFMEFLAAVGRGEKRINAGVAQPHLLLHQAINGGDLERAVAEGMWRTLVAKLRKQLSPLQRMAVGSVDTSGSMYELIVDGNAKLQMTRLQVAAALALLLADINEGPMSGCLYTFSDRPQLVKIQGTTVKERFEWLEQLGKDTWGFQTNIRQLFRDIITNRQANQLPRQVVVFSDMEFSDLSIPDLQRRLRRERGKRGLMTVSLMWNTHDDLDLHCITPDGHEIFYGERKWQGAVLDVDMNAYGVTSREPVENIYWADEPLPGTYTFFVQNYSYKQTPVGQPVRFRLTFRIGNLVHHEEGQCLGFLKGSNVYFPVCYQGLEASYWGQVPTQIVEDVTEDCAGSWRTEYSMIKEMFERDGLSETEIPRVTFWNLTSPDGELDSFGFPKKKFVLPVQQNEQGAAIVTGFSPRTFNTILQGGAFMVRHEKKQLSRTEDDAPSTMCEVAEGNDSKETEFQRVTKDSSAEVTPRLYSEGKAANFDHDPQPQPKRRKGQYQEKKVDPLAMMMRAIDKPPFRALRVVWTRDQLAELLSSIDPALTVGEKNLSEPEHSSEPEGLAELIIHVPRRKLPRKCPW